MQIQQEKMLEVKNDGLIRVAVGSHRWAKKWKNKELLWSELLDKLSITTRTRETVTEYKHMTRDQRSNIKDVGGFVGGVLKEGKRKKGQVAWRSLITLDADFLEEDIWDVVEMLYANSIAMYTTHSHTAESPKVRLIIPLSRQVTGDEYKAIARYVAAEIGIDFFDDTTYQPERLMYWPSTPADGEYIFRHIDGPFLDPDVILNAHPDWRDMSTWPESSRAHKLYESTAEKQGDPLEKPGVVGAFCRSYTISEAISEFLSDVYEICDTEGRYTYIAGTASAGVVVYDDIFSYSHHGTDPAGGVLCNAFDLVRIHKFGKKDLDVREDTPVHKLPSYTAMSEFCLRDDKVRIELASVKKEELEEEFGLEVEEIKEDEDDTWRSKLKFDTKGNIQQTINNAVKILRNDSNINGSIGYDEFGRSFNIKGPIAWRPKNKKVEVWSDSDDSNLRHYLETIYGLKKREAISDAVTIVMNENKFHPVRDYLDSLEWDGVARLDTMLIDYLGADDSEYTRAISRKWMAAGVARIREPGIKFDNMLILVGEQGMGKSQFFSRISVSPKWFSDSMGKFDNTKESMEQLAGKWIIELGELSAMKKAEVEHVKVFLSKQEDTYRPSYGRRTETYARQCIFGGTTNRDDFLIDSTGARRFWPVRVENTEKLWSHLTREVVDQLWAEADVVYSLGEDLYLSGNSEKISRELQEQFSAVNSKTGVAAEFLDIKIPEDWDSKSIADKVNYYNGFGDNELTNIPLIGRDTISGIELFVECFGGRIDNYNRKDQYEMAEILRWIGWEKSGKRKKIKEYGKQRYYIRPKK